MSTTAGFSWHFKTVVNEDLSMATTARYLNRHESIISGEITLRSVVNKNSCYGRNYNACARSCVMT